MKEFDLIVIGAGPAGTTLASLVKKYDPESRVLLLEKTPFPRHHVGESLLPGMIPVLKEMGVFERLRDAGFLKKIGATFVWGRDRKPWDADFNNLNIEMIEKYGRALDTEFSWQVRRSEYDAILLDHARALGAEARLGVRAAGLIEEDGRVVGVEIEAEGGGKEALRCGLLADCSGQSGFLSRYFPTRAYRDELKNIAGYAYFRGAKWKYEYAGHPDKTKIFICSVPAGWFWYIPIARDLVSVGLVAKADFMRRKGVTDFRAEYFSALKSCSEIAPLLERAELVRGVDGEDRDFFTAGDWSFTSRAACGPGWLAAGDAAFFLDPLLSSGVMMAHISGHRAAYTINTVRRESDPRVRALLWEDYDRFCKEAAGSFEALVSYWYAHEPCAEAWWGVAKSAVSANTPLDLSDKMAFVAAASGLTYHYERLYTSQGFALGSLGKEHAWQWEGTKHDMKRWTRQVLAIVETGFLGLSASSDPEVKRAEELARLEAIPDAWVPRWTVERRSVATFLPAAGDGVLRPVTRVDFLRRPVDDSVAHAANPKRLLPSSLGAIVDLVDGRRSVGEIKRRMRAAVDLPGDLLDGQVFRLLKDLAVLGVLSLERRAAEEAMPEPPSAFREGESALRRGDCGSAERFLSEYLSLGGVSAWAFALRGEARRHLGKSSQALADIEKAVSLLLEPAESAPGDRLEALAREFDRDIRRGWILDRVFVLRGKLRLELGDAAGARSDAAAALGLNSRHSEALVLRAKASRALGKVETAGEDLRAALEIENSGRRGQG